MTTTDQCVTSVHLDPDTLGADLDVLRKWTGHVLIDLVANHVLAAHADSGRAVLRAALDATARRFEIARRDRLRVASRPIGDWRGIYTTRLPRAKARPWRTLLTSVEPLVASCGCPDFRGSSLGLCKHIVAVLDDLAGRKRRFERARSDGYPPTDDVRLHWIPFKPLFGSGDWLERLCLEGGRPGRSKVWARVRRLFAASADGTSRVRATYADDPRKRLKTLVELQTALKARSPGLPSDPAVGTLIADERVRLETAVGLAPVRHRLASCLEKLGRAPYPYQVEGVERFLATGRLLLADDMGLGKTIQAVAACYALWRGDQIRRGLLVVPAPLKSQWQCEWETCCDAPIAIVDGSQAERAELYRTTKSGFLIANYEQLLRDLDIVRAWRPEVVVLDEAQRIKNWATQTAAAVKQLTPPFRLVLTGTPFENRLLELDSILEWLDRQPLQPQWRIDPFHTTAEDGVTKLRGARHLDVLRERLAPILLRRRRREILTQLPSRTDTRVDVPLTDVQREEHDALAPSIASLVARAERRPLTQGEFLRLMQLLTQQRIIANGIGQQEFVGIWSGLKHAAPTAPLRAGLSMPKLEELRELVERVAVDQERKIVVFSQWQRALRLAHWACRDLFDAHDIDAAFFTGAENHRRRADNIVRFHDDPRVRILFATDAGGVGLNLQRAATCCINFDLPWNPAVLEQRIARIHRLGQEHPIDVYNLVSEASIESRIANLVREKHALFAGLFDGDSDEIRFDEVGGFLATVRKIVDAEVTAPDSDVDVDAAAPRAGQIAQPQREVPPPVAESLEPAAIEGLLARLDVRPRPDGGIRIDAPPEAAASLVALFRGIADLLARSADGEADSGG